MAIIDDSTQNCGTCRFHIPLHMHQNPHSEHICGLASTMLQPWQSAEYRAVLVARIEDSGMRRMGELVNSRFPLADVEAVEVTSADLHTSRSFSCNKWKPATPPQALSTGASA